MSRSLWEEPKQQAPRQERLRVLAAELRSEAPRAARFFFGGSHAFPKFPMDLLSLLRRRFRDPGFGGFNGGALKGLGPTRGGSFGGNVENVVEANDNQNNLKNLTKGSKDRDGFSLPGYCLFDTHICFAHPIT